MPGPLPYLILGNPENRRVSLFVKALRSLGQPEPTVLAHAELLQTTATLRALPDSPRLLRIDALGENPAVERALIARGYQAARDEDIATVAPGELASQPPLRGRILCPRQQHLGFLDYLAELAAIVADHPSWVDLQPLTSLAELFDKPRCWQRYRELGLSVPEAQRGVRTPAQLRDVMARQCWRSVFVKLSSGSSASCLAVYRLHRGGQASVMTTIERSDAGWFNSLRVHRIDEPRAIDEVLGFLLREGSHVERAVPKAKLDGAFFDCRVLLIDGDPLFTVVRQNRHPITNLHLGGWRGDLDKLHRALPDASMTRAMESCRRVGRLHGCFHLGVDLMFEPDLERHLVLEANAFGDLLPGLQREGRDVYQWQIAAAQRRVSGVDV